MESVESKLACSLVVSLGGALNAAAIFPAAFIKKQSIFKDTLVKNLA